jgi:hypothetical protein
MSHYHIPPAGAGGVEFGSERWHSYQGSTASSMYGGTKAPLQHELAGLKSLIEEMVREQRRDEISVWLAELEVEEFKARQVDKVIRECTAITDR